MTDIAANLASLRARMKSAKLIAVGKGHGADAILEALKAGQRVFGENRVQEAREKFSALRALYPDIELHMIGPLQTNKARDAVELFDVVQTLDRPKLAAEIAAAIRETGHRPRLYIEVNIGNEPQKAGIAPEKIDEFLAYCRGNYGLSVTGLMCVPPQGRNPRPFFRRMKQMAARLSLPNLSMGMSADFEAAIECGATEVRIGAALFGMRNTTD